MRKTKGRAIREYCFQCSGESHKEVTICHLFDCPLWPYRTGAHVSSKAYIRRIEAAMRNYPKDIKALAEMGVDLAEFAAGGQASSSPGDDLSDREERVREVETPSG